MKCHYCNNDNTKVIDSRPAEDNNSIRRRRQCEKCDKRFTTYEKVETIPLVVIKKDKKRETFNREKLMAGVVRSCHKRPVSMKEIESVVDDIENIVHNSMQKEIESKEIGELLMEKLKNIDEVAYVRFASVYREFKDVNTFMDELKKILNETK
ncbi:transcriptional repressor NrdR [Natranaerovirga pectinivora]|uniref:Transcriptional repressor NrdR n=1 Tax=Natranaerovirga pectinivora TaxID=682400 RepID=A0A4R3MNM1_9FIRM|nr:transcriptional regulator NrdR [Natranaerovirga pectinivora]TCT16865.1 transcriptional repressor NrdR [Natranaerovirga pectinivora]